jgi:hypothetical protein
VFSLSSAVAPSDRRKGVALVAFFTVIVEKAIQTARQAVLIVPLPTLARHATPWCRGVAHHDEAHGHEDGLRSRHPLARLAPWSMMQRQLGSCSRPAWRPR